MKTRHKNDTWTENVLRSFPSNGKDGFYPAAGLILDASGNLYGTTSGGGAHVGQCGTVFELIRGANGSWTEKLLHSFNNFNCNDTDGADPEGGLVFDTAGNIYGTTFYGGTFNSGCPGGCGTVFELLPSRNGEWTEKVLHRFNNNARDGFGPYNTTPILDTAGNVYGVTLWGGVNNKFGGGAMFELTPEGNGKWTEKVLHSFNKGTDGEQPSGGLVLDTYGNLYGTTYGGGINNNGTVFMITP